MVTALPIIRASIPICSVSTLYLRRDEPFPTVTLEPAVTPVVNPVPAFTNKSTLQVTGQVLDESQGAVYLSDHRGVAAAL